MRFYLFALLLLAAPAFASWTHAYTYNQRAAPAVTIPLAGATATVAFSPNGDGTKIIVNAIKHAQHRILVQAYGFTSRPIERALVQAEKRGVVVEAVFDKSTFSERYSEADVGALMEHGVPMWEDWSPAIAHNKVMVIDGGTASPAASTSRRRRRRTTPRMSSSSRARRRWHTSMPRTGAGGAGSASRSTIKLRRGRQDGVKQYR